MIVPSKVTPYNKSSYAKFAIVLTALEKKSMTPKELYLLLSPKTVKNILEYVEILDCLYSMKQIEMKEGVLYYVV